MDNRWAYRGIFVSQYAVTVAGLIGLPFMPEYVFQIRQALPRGHADNIGLPSGWFHAARTKRLPVPCNVLIVRQGPQQNALIR